MGQQVSCYGGVDGITLLVTVVCTVFFNSIKTMAVVKHTLKNIYLSPVSVFSFKLLFCSLVLPI